MLFSDWITRKYIEWRGDRVGNEGSITEFAKLFGASQPVVSNWMTKGGKIPRSQKYLTALFKVYGKEVLEVLGIQEPETVYQDIELLPPEWRDRLRAATEEANRRMEAAGLTGSSPGAEHLIRETFEKYGFVYTKTDTDDDPGSEK